MHAKCLVSCRSGFENECIPWIFLNLSLEHLRVVEPIHEPASRITTRGRGRERGQDRGQGRECIATHVEGQVPTATEGHGSAVPPIADVTHRDVQDRVKGDGPAQAQLGFIATLVLQDTLVRMLRLL
ncbi:hypothetical protein KY284_012812 [Solanum tuberosum]|nr:hypothetical protein KY284_012812 [Solanum tuberosum]